MPVPHTYPLIVIPEGQLKPFVIVFFSGINLMLIQWAMTCEVNTLLLGTELVVLLISVCYFIGSPSVVCWQGALTTGGSLCLAL